MGMRISQEERNYADQIYQLRQKKDLNKAIGVCLDAIARFHTSNFFHKICGDIYYELREYQDAVNMYMELLDRIKGIPEYFTNFTKFIKKVNDLLKTLLKCFIGLVLIFANANYKAFVALIF